MKTGIVLAGLLWSYTMFVLFMHKEGKQEWWDLYSEKDIAFLRSTLKPAVLFFMAIAALIAIIASVIFFRSH